jgi:GNAT superfamily N-acetyltransferase
MHGAVVRRGTLGDARALIAMHRECAPETLEARFLTPMPNLTAEQAVELLQPVDGFSLVADASGTLAGLITVAPGADRIAAVGLLVSDAWHGRGIGTALLHAAVREATAAGIAELHFTVHPTNTAVYPMINAAGLRARVSTREGITSVDIPLHTPSPSSSTQP